MAIEVESKPQRVQVNEAQRPEGLKDNDVQAVANAADRVDAQKVADKIDSTSDRFDRADETPTTSGLPLSWLTGSGSPVESQGVVDRMKSLGALGDGDAAKFDRSKYNGLLSNDPSKPFTGSGATGVSPVDGRLPPGDLITMARFQNGEKTIKQLGEHQQELNREMMSPQPDLSEAERDLRMDRLEAASDRNRANYERVRDVQDGLRPTVDSYRNPLSFGTETGDPKDQWDDKTREDQANLLLEQPISTIHGDAYGEDKPTRAEVVEAAAEKYDLDPNVLAGVILQEQRDQSAKEDVADLGGAALGGRDTSIGLGQVLMSTAMKNDADLLSDTVSAEDRKNLSRGEVARLLSSDEHNIFATARYLRSVADQASTYDGRPNPLDSTRREFPNFDRNGYAGPAWSDDNIRAIASEYTSKPWDDVVLEAGGYPQFVLDAVNDVRRSGVFR